MEDKLTNILSAFQPKRRAKPAKPNVSLKITAEQDEQISLVAVRLNCTRSDVVRIMIQTVLPEAASAHGSAVTVGWLIAELRSYDPHLPVYIAPKLKVLCNRCENHMDEWDLDLDRMTISHSEAKFRGPSGEAWVEIETREGS